MDRNVFLGGGTTGRDSASACVTTRLPYGIRFVKGIMNTYTTGPRPALRMDKDAPLDPA